MFIDSDVPEIVNIVSSAKEWRKQVEAGTLTEQQYLVLLADTCKVIKVKRHMQSLGRLETLNQVFSILQALSACHQFNEVTYEKGTICRDQRV